MCASRRELPNFGETYRFLAAIYAHLGRLDEAHNVITQLQSVSPALVARGAASWRNPEHRELLLSGLQLAIGEEPEWGRRGSMHLPRRSAPPTSFWRVSFLLERWRCARSCPSRFPLCRCPSSTWP